jgi:ABC-type branched-subunit amino acid transport system permease subunit
VSAVTAVRDRLRGPAGSTLVRHLLGLVVGVVAIVVLTAAVPDYQHQHLGVLGANIAAAAGLTVLIGLSGQISLGHGAFMAIGGYTVALLQARFSDAGVTGVWVLPTSLLAAIVVTAVAGAVIGVAAARLRGPYLAGATLALGVALPSITSTFSGVFKGEQGLPVPVDSPPASLGANFSFPHWQAWIALFSAAVALFFLANVSRSGIGRNLRAVRDDEIAAQLCGLSVPRLQVLTFTVSAAAAGLGGGALAVVLYNATPGSYGLTLSLSLLAAAVIGGLGSLTGAVLGSVVVVYLSEFFTDAVDGLGLSGSAATNLHDNLPNAFYGLLLVLVMIALPGGIHGLLRRLPALLPRTHRFEEEPDDQVDPQVADSRDRVRGPGGGTRVR